MLLNLIHFQNNSISSIYLNKIQFDFFHYFNRIFFKSDLRVNNFNFLKN
jgi:hypothetical protein